MTDFVKAAAFAAKKTLALKGIKVQHGVALEIVAAFLGYRTYAALVADLGNQSLKYHLADAEVIVLDFEGGSSRLNELEVMQAFIAQDFIDAIVNSRDFVYPDVHDFLNRYAQRELDDVILSNEGVFEAVEHATGSEPFSVDVDSTWSFSNCLWTSVDTWVISCFGTVVGLTERASPNNDDPVEEVRCSGWIKFAKAGRAGLIFQRSGGEAASGEEYPLI